MQTAVQNHKNIVLDRYYASTIAYIIGKQVDKPLPKEGDEELIWPNELYRPTFMFYLELPEADRLLRRSNRECTLAETAEEAYLREHPDIAERINAMYTLLGCTRILISATDSPDEVVDKIIYLIESSKECIESMPVAS